MSEVTRLLGAIEQGDPKAADQLLPLVYGELRRLAAHKMAHEAAGQTLQPTALVHEAWLRLGMRNRHPPTLTPVLSTILFWQSRTGLKLLAQRLRRRSYPGYINKTHQP
jgi:hypothetical protein